MPPDKQRPPGHVTVQELQIMNAWRLFKSYLDKLPGIPRDPEYEAAMDAWAQKVQDAFNFRAGAPP